MLPLVSFLTALFLYYNSYWFYSFLKTHFSDFFHLFKLNQSILSKWFFYRRQLENQSLSAPPVCDHHSDRSTMAGRQDSKVKEEEAELMERVQGSEATEGTSEAQEGVSEAQTLFRTGLIDDDSDSEEEWDDLDDEASPSPQSYNPGDGSDDEYDDKPTIEAIVNEVTRSFNNYARLLSLMMGRGLLPKSQKCPKCNRRMILQKWNYVAGKEVSLFGSWRASSILKKSSFENEHLLKTAIKSQRVQKSAFHGNISQKFHISLHHLLYACMYESVLRAICFLPASYRSPTSRQSVRRRDASLRCKLLESIRRHGGLLGAPKMSAWGAALPRRQEKETCPP